MQPAKLLNSVWRGKNTCAQTQTLSLLHKDHGRSREISLDNYKSYKLSNDFTTLPAHDRLEDRQLLFYQFFAGDLFQCKPRILVGHYSTQ
jgi:hypothetical protein